MTTHTVNTQKGQRFTYVAETAQQAMQMASKEIRQSGSHDKIVGVTSKTSKC